MTIFQVLGIVLLSLYPGAIMVVFSFPSKTCTSASCHSFVRPYELSGVVLYRQISILILSITQKPKDILEKQKMPSKSYVEY